ncbi:MAG: hypothetical protein WED00_10550 [Aquisalimonadaceae bacterium]
MSSRGDRPSYKSVDRRAREILERQPMYIPDEPDWMGNPEDLLNDDLLDDSKPDQKERKGQGDDE